jgi:PmbA protein
VVKDGSIGFSFYSRKQEKNEAIKRAVKSARVTPKEGFSFPRVKSHQPARQFDEKIKELSEEQVVECLSQAMQGASKKASPSKGEVSVGWTKTKVSNSNGLDLNRKDSLFSVFASAKKKDSVGYDYFDCKQFSNKSLEVGENASHWASIGVKGKPVDFQGPVVLSVETISNFFQACVLRNLNGENARRGKSLWEKNQEVTSEKISLLDDPFLDWKPGTTGFDDEGVPCREKTLIERGVLKKRIFDARSASLAKTKSTGNGFRTSFSSMPSIGFTNLVLKVPGSDSTEVLDVKKGVFVRELMGFHNMNTVTGDFALDIAKGFLIENGELGRAVKGCMLVGNFLEVLKGPMDFDSNPRWRGSFCCPRMRFNGRVVSK